MLRADRVLYWELPDQLAAVGAQFGFGTLFADAAARAQAVIDWLWHNPMHEPHLVHGDGYVASHAERARAWMQRPAGL